MIKKERGAAVAPLCSLLSLLSGSLLFSRHRREHQDQEPQDKHTNYPGDACPDPSCFVVHRVTPSVPMDRL
jgi:hypothetical protein